MKNSVHPLPAKLPPVKPTPRGAFLLKVAMVPALGPAVPGTVMEESEEDVREEEQKVGKIPETRRDSHISEENSRPGSDSMMETRMTESTMSDRRISESQMSDRRISESQMSDRKISESRMSDRRISESTKMSESSLGEEGETGTRGEYKERIDELASTNSTCCWRPNREVEMEQIMKHLNLDIRCDVCWTWLQINMNKLAKTPPKRRLMLLNEGNARLGSYRKMHSTQSRVIMASLIVTSFIMFLLGVILIGVNHSTFRPFDTMLTGLGGMSLLIMSALYVSCVLERWTQKHTCEAWKVEEKCLLP